MWIVYDNEEGLVVVTNDYDLALEEYERCVKTAKEYIKREGEFTSDERVILAEVKKHFYGHETDEKAIDNDENGEEFETEDYLWDWKEDIY